MNKKLLMAAGIAALSSGLFGFSEIADRTEAYSILPNESAFWVPSTGANKNSQTKFESEAYYNDSKIAAKMFVIPHQKLSGSGGTSWFSGPDFYIPTGRLYLVDRTPYSREWVDATDRGTSTKKEGFPCQSKDGVNITAGVSISASVSEDNAAKFLYNFGVVNPTGDQTSTAVIFASVYNGRSLVNVMDDVGRKRVQTLVCNEIGKLSFDQANDQMIPMMDRIEKEARTYFDSVGVTINFIGWGDTFTFDPAVQHAVNERYIAEKLQPVLPILQAVAQLKVQEGMGEGLASHGLPVVITPGMIETALGLVKGFGANTDVKVNAVTPPAIK